MRRGMILSGWAVLALSAPASAAPAAAEPALRQILSYPFVGGLVAAAKADRVAWVRTVRGVRNIWVAGGADRRARQVTRYTQDDGQELTNLAFSPDGRRLVYVRGGDHDANWPGDGGLDPNPLGGTEQPKVAIWAAALDGGAPVKIAEGDAPVLSATGRLAFVRDGQVWTAGLDGQGKDKGKAERLFFDRGRARDLAWSPDGTKLAFVSGRTEHALIGVFAGKTRPILYAAPSTGIDGTPVWSPDGTRIAFTRRPGDGGVPEPLLEEVPHPWSIWTADAATGEGRPVWRSGKAADDSFPGTAGGANLGWAAGDRLTFLSEADGWPHLYSVAAAGGAATLLTPGRYMVEHVALSPDGRTLVYDANTGTASGDDDRRHLYRVAVDRPGATALTAGEALEWSPVVTGAGVSFVSADARRPASVHAVALDGTGERAVDDGAAGYAAQSLVVPRPVTFKAADGLLVHGQLFEAAGGAAKKPAVIFVHGGPPRQMLLGWHYMFYYSNAYAMNQYLASRGFVVLSVNYRLGIGYGRAFQHPKKAGPAGAAEYQDVVAGARFLKGLAGVDPDRIGIWGGSYGGYLTGLALARDSATFKAGVDLHGVHDWSRILGEEIGAPLKRHERGDWDQAMKVAFESSPDADVATWRSPVLLIHGDDDRNVRINQTVDLVRRLDAQGVEYEEMLIPDEIHDFLRHENWLKADAATARFLEAKLKP